MHDTNNIQESQDVTGVLADDFHATLKWTPEHQRRRDEAKRQQHERGDGRRALAAERLAKIGRTTELDEVTRLAVAAEMNLLIRGAPTATTTLAYATGFLAQLRDVLLEVEPKARRARAARWMVEDVSDEDERTARWETVELLMASRDFQRERIRREREKSFFQKTPGEPALVAGDEDAPPLPKYNPQTFITTLSKRHDAGKTTEWTSLCPMTKDWKTDAAAYGKRVQRLVNQLGEEQADGATFYAMTVDAGEWETLYARWNKRAQRGGATARWAKLPQEDDRVVVIHDSHQDAGDGVQVMPSDAAGLRAFVFPLLRTPEGQKATTSDGFGGCYQGARGDGRRHQAKRDGATVELVGQFVTSGAGGLARAAQVLEIELSKRLRGRRELEHEDAVVALLQAGFQLLPRHAHQAGLAALLAAFVLANEPPDEDEVEMSGISHIEEESSIVRYTGHKPYRDAPPVEWKPPDKREMVAAPVPIYLPGGESW